MFKFIYIYIYTCVYIYIYVHKHVCTCTHALHIYIYIHKTVCQRNCIYKLSHLRPLQKLLRHVFCQMETQMVLQHKTMVVIKKHYDNLYVYIYIYVPVTN